MEHSTKQLLFGLMGGIFHDTRKILDEIFKNMNLSRQEWLLLAMLRLQPKGLLQSEGMKYVGVEKSYFTKMLNQLENKGYIIREIDPSNRRNRIIKANPKNTKKINKVFKIIYDYTDNVQASISEEEAKTVRDILLKVQKSINKYNNPE
jgi:DNA-binding MarR family transcriptional regulator